jgi:cyclopropane fatty-acyl-phospholipid synthase-like methyltransferase
MSHMTQDDFEARYQADIDPWGYRRSPYEQAKYEATLRACGTRRFARGLELGSSIGVLSAQLASRCERLVTIDAAPTAVAEARRRLAGRPGLEIVLGAIPRDIPAGAYDLVVTSEILYYLSPGDLEATLTRLGELSSPGARWVAVHWRPAGPERPFTADEVHERLRGLDWLRPISRHPTDEYLLDVLERA